MKITIKSGEFSAEANTHGAELISLKSGETEYLWQGDKAYWGGQAPVLFPHVGGLRNNKAVLNGKEIESLRHGFARKSEFAVKEQTESSVTLSLSPNELSKPIYPYDFEFIVKYTLDGAVLTTEFITKNLSENDMPFAVGGHPAFNVPLEKGEEFTDYEIVFDTAETFSCPTVNLQTGLINFGVRMPILNATNTIPLEHKLFYSDALVFDFMKSNTVKVCSKKTGHGIEVNFEEFPYLGIWSTVNDAPFVAVEPWTGCATCEDEDDEFTHKRGMKFLKPQEISVVKFTSKML